MCIYCYYLLGIILTTSVDRFFCPRGCGRSYKRKDHCWRHIKYECGVPRQFKCTYCPRSFAHNSALKKHIIVVHKMSPDNGS